MKISVSSYSFHKLLEDNQITQLGCIQTAKDMGFDAIEFTNITPPDGKTIADYAKEISDEAKRVDLPISNYAISADFLNGFDGDINSEIDRIKEQVDIAEILGVPYMRHDATSGYNPEFHRYAGFDTVLPILVEGCRQVTEYAKTKGIKTMVENHGYFSQDSLRVEKLINAVANENFGWLCDMGNFLCADENPVTSVSRAAPYAFYVHAKDFHVKSGMSVNPGDGFFMSRGGNYLRGAIVGHGDVPVKQCLAALKRVHYDGYVAIEFEGMEDALLGIKIGLANLRRFIADTN